MLGAGIFLGGPWFDHEAIEATLVPEMPSLRRSLDPACQIRPPTTDWIAPCDKSKNMNCSKSLTAIPEA